MLPPETFTGIGVRTTLPSGSAIDGAYDNHSPTGSSHPADCGTGFAPRMPKYSKKEVGPCGYITF